MSKFQNSYMKIVVKRENVNPLQWSSDINILANTGMRKLAEGLRDEMREAYLDSIGHTMYGAFGSDYNQLWRYIVVSPRYSPVGVYSVGAMNKVINTGMYNQTVEEIFKFMDEGTGQYGKYPSKGHWVFPLNNASSEVSENGMWATNGQEPKEFITGTATAYTGKFIRESEVLLNPMIKAYIMGGGGIKI